jgi:RNA polymerase sigma-70 factor (ECF subfamily)
MEWETQSDEQLLAALAADPAALAPLYDRYAKLVFGIAFAVLANQDEAEDLVQEVFLAVTHEPGQYDARRGALGAYLTTLTRSRAIDRLRRRTRRVRLLRDWWQATPVLDPAPTPLDHLALGRNAERVRTALATLSPNERRALEMAYFQGLTQAEIAETLDTPIGTVKSWCRRGLLGLKEALGDLVE